MKSGTIALIMLIGTACGAEPIADRLDPKNPARLEGARRTIQKAQAYTKWADTFVAQTDKDVHQAKVLSGTAKKYQSNIVPALKPLKGAKLSEAKAMFQLDLSQF